MSHRAGLTRTRNMYYGFESRYELTKTIMLKIEGADVMHFLTSSSCHPKVFVKEFCYFLMSCHQHCLGVNLLVQR